MDSDELMMECEERMENALKSFKETLQKARTGRANPKMLDGVKFEYYGVETPITQVAGISVPEANQIYIKPYDKSALGEINKAILAANLGVTPQNDGIGIRIVLPPMTEENRRNTVKDCKKQSEDAKIVIRNIRSESNNQLKKNEKEKEISEDMLDAYLKDVQDLTDKFIKLIDEALNAKVNDIMTI
ncbi:MAG: ribosome recycling factor [Gammaproteobacteria bacterium]|nr:ribosome recycling factor [Gammaproteobacteria bacterium]